MTIMEALERATQILNGISVPIPYLQQIGIPIKESADLVKAAIDAIKQNQEENKEEPDEEVDEENAPVFDIDELPEEKAQR